MSAENVIREEIEKASENPKSICIESDDATIRLPLMKTLAVIISTMVFLLGIMGGGAWWLSGKLTKIDDSVASLDRKMTELVDAHKPRYHEEVFSSISRGTVSGAVLDEVVVKEKREDGHK